MGWQVLLHVDCHSLPSPPGVELRGDVLDGGSAQAVVDAGDDGLDGSDRSIVPGQVHWHFQNSSLVERETVVLGNFSHETSDGSDTENWEIHDF